jgi:hypothetical protein
VRAIVKTIAWVSILGMGLSVLACGPSSGTGTVTFTTWGEEFIEQGLGADLFIKDHWSVKYTQFLIALRSVAVEDESRSLGADLRPPQVFDMTKPGDKRIASFSLEAKSWPHVSYQIGPITADAVHGELASAADVTAMQITGASIRVAGIATGPQGESKTFDWSFSTPTLYENCRGEQAGKEVDGVLVTNGGTQVVQITIHGDHLFYDDLQSEDAILRFQALANADFDNDGIIALDELDRVPLYTLPDSVGPYGTGALGNVNTLGDYERTLARTFGHYRGEGSCNSRTPSL